MPAPTRTRPPNAGSHPWRSSSGPRRTGKDTPLLHSRRTPMHLPPCWPPQPRIIHRRARTRLTTPRGPVTREPCPRAPVVESRPPGGEPAANPRNCPKCPHRHTKGTPIYMARTRMALSGRPAPREAIMAPTATRSGSPKPRPRKGPQVRPGPGMGRVPAARMPPNSPIRARDPRGQQPKKNGCPWT